MNRYANQTLLSLEGKYLFTHSFPAPSEDRNLYTCVYTVYAEYGPIRMQLYEVLCERMVISTRPVRFTPILSDNGLVYGSG